MAEHGTEGEPAGAVARDQPETVSRGLALLVAGSFFMEILDGTVLAPAIGGTLSTYASWRWIFLINVPLGVAAFVLARRLVPDIRAARPVGLDLRGFALTAVGVAALVIGLENLGSAAPRPATVVV